YLVARDSFISNWQIPVDIGYQTITYRFPLESGYRYRIKVITYHESSGQWREKVKIDNKLQHLIKYNAYEPETLEFWIPPAFYKDGAIDVVFERISGDFATTGPIYIYQYEEETTELASGPMAQQTKPREDNAVSIYPNPFSAVLNIRLTDSQNGKMSIKVYDISGRLVREWDNMKSDKVIWDGTDNDGRIISQGIYFLQIRDCDTGKSTVHKILKVR
ncbi:MAG: T9SS type A sorting domain-containing protein, partial [candidate division WOR-3 bacterium]